jgi:ribosomal protein S18 acetylase RimI-like enzyme
MTYRPTETPIDKSLPVAVRKARADERDLVVDILADAFHDDPALLWLSAHPDFPHFIFDLIIRGFVADGGILVDESGSAAALFMPPGKKMPSGITMGNAMRGLLKFGPMVLIRALELLSLYDRQHYRDEHVYIFAIGNRPAVRKRGLGSAVMKHLLASSGADEYPVYLENSKPANLQFYAKFGFERQTDFNLPRRGPPVTSMLRRRCGDS